MQIHCLTSNTDKSSLGKVQVHKTPFPTHIDSPISELTMGKTWVSIGMYGYVHTVLPGPIPVSHVLSEIILLFSIFKRIILVPIVAK